MKFIEKHSLWILLAIIILLIVIVWQRTKVTKSPDGGDEDKIGDPDTSGNPKPPTGTTTPDSPIVLNRYGTDHTRWEVDDKLVAIAPKVNVYKSPMSAQGNVEETALSGQVIGRLIHWTGTTERFAKVEYLTTTFGIPYIKKGYVFITNGLSGIPSNVKSVRG